MTGNGLFHLQSGVFGHAQLLMNQCRQTGATGLTQQQRGLRIHVDKYNL